MTVKHMPYCTTEIRGPGISNRMVKKLPVSRKQSGPISVALCPHWLVCSTGWVRCFASTSTQAVGLQIVSLLLLCIVPCRHLGLTRLPRKTLHCVKQAWPRLCWITALYFPQLERCPECSHALYDFKLQYCLWACNPVFWVTFLQSLPLPCLLMSFQPCSSMPPTLRFMKRSNLGGLC